MGYTTKFAGEIHVSPPLNAAEREYLQRFSRSRRMASPLGPYALDTEGAAPDANRVPTGQPGLWCQWVPTENGAQLVWDGHEKFYRSSAWMTYLIDTFLRRGALLQHELEDPVVGRQYPGQLREFTFDHSMYGTVLATGQDGATWRIEVRDNEVTVVVTSGPAPTEYTLFLLPRASLFELEREFDAAFDLVQFEDGYAAMEDVPALVEDCVRELFPQAHRAADEAGPESTARVVLRDERSGLTVTVYDRDIRIGLLAARALPDAERLFGLVQQLARAITQRIGWIAYDPAQRVALRPGERFRDRAIGMIRGFTEEPDGRWAWNVV